MNFLLKLRKKTKKSTSNNNDIIQEINDTNDDINKKTIPMNNGKHLICDDAFTNRLVLKKYLNLFGFEADEAENGQYAIDKVTENGAYRIIWMDIKMPKMDGFDATRILKRDMEYPGPIIGLTGYVDEVTIAKCYSLGMCHVVSKPFDKQVIKMYCEKY